MATFKDLLNQLQSLSEEQLNQKVLIIPTGYCDVAPLDELDGFSPFSGNVEIATAKGDIVYSESPDSPQCGSAVAGTLDLGEVEGELETQEVTVILPAGSTYIKVSSED